MATFSVTPSPIRAIGDVRKVTLHGNGTAWTNMSTLQVSGDDGVVVEAVGVPTVIDSGTLNFLLSLGVGSSGTLTISVDADTATVGVIPNLGVTLMDIERALALRIGPYRLEQQSELTQAGVNIAYIDRFRTSVGLGGIEDMYLLRRGIDADGGQVAGFVPSDRTRVVSSVDPTFGSVRPDRNWINSPVADELFEFHHLDPDARLKPAVLAGLRRCYVEDRVTLNLASSAAERDITSSVFWITQPSQITRVQLGLTGQTILPVDLPWWQPFVQAGHLWVAGWPSTAPNTLVVTALRPVWSLVNGADSSTGPENDFDVLDVDIDYAVAAAHIEAWRLFPARLKQAADAGYQASQQQAAYEFTRQARLHVRRRAQDWKLSSPFSEPHTFSHLR